MKKKKLLVGRGEGRFFDILFDWKCIGLFAVKEQNWKALYFELKIEAADFLGK